MNTTNSSRSFREISPTDALMRSQQYPSTSIIGPSGAGKTAFINAVFNKNLSKILKIGVGDKNQTTLFTCNFVLDSRISEDKFAFKVRTQPFDYKRIVTIVVDALCDLFWKNDYSAEETVRNISDSWLLHHVLEPAKATYRLSEIKEQISIEELKDAVLLILKNMETYQGSSFEDLLKEKKKEPSLKAFKNPEIRQQLFTTLWDNTDQIIKGYFQEWLQSVEKVVWMEFCKQFQYEWTGEPPADLLLEGSVLETEKANALRQIFNPKAPYSLIIREAYLACRPHEELYKDKAYDLSEPPFRLCLRDTVGVNQSANDMQTIQEGIEVGLTYRANSLLILLNLEDRDDTLKPFCNIIHDQLEKKSSTQHKSVYVLFTKGDKLIGTRVSQKTNNLVIGQKDYNENIIETILEVEEKAEQFVNMIGRCDARWISLRYYEKEDDPIQKALEEYDNKRLMKELRESHKIKLMADQAFKPIGLYSILEQMTKSILDSMLPPGMAKPHYVSVPDRNKVAIELFVDKTRILEKLTAVKKVLTQEKINVNAYLFPSEPVAPNYLEISPWTVNAYWSKLQLGLGHNSKSDPGKYLNISINMKSLVYRSLTAYMSIEQLYNMDAVSVSAANLKGDLTELEGILNALQINQLSQETKAQFSEEGSLFRRYEQVLNEKLKEYFSQPYRQLQVLDAVAQQLTFGNQKVIDRLESVYGAQYSHDRSMRRVQNELYKLFSSEEFNDLLVEEVGRTMTEMINKLFITV
ncbi:GTPase domain-containing protein [Paenibacillus sp. EC2-1]|uniref:GTPase domain-containing protein n=1 Tax=Paenibacillus sp. EC2-1 TaxID=3388665 RepID=UPI003BEEDB02